MIGVTHQYNEDSYWITVTKPEGQPPKLNLTSCAMGFVPLKDCISDRDYDNIDSTWGMNGCSIEECIKIAEDEVIIIS